MPKLLLYELRRLRAISSSLSLSFSLYRPIQSHTLNSNNNSLFSPSYDSHNNFSNYRRKNLQFRHTNNGSSSFVLSNFMLFRSLSIDASSNDNLENDGSSQEIESRTESESLNLGFKGGDGVLVGDEWYDPVVQKAIDFLDGFHDLTGLPWWVTIASSTFALRVTLLPVLILQLKKLKKISELLPKLPPPFPPPFSGKKYSEQYMLFQKEKRAAGCPSFLWFIAYVSVQVPCFLLWMTAIRRMSLNHHPGFDCGGTLWFQDLSEMPHGAFGPIFPVLIAGLHFANVQISFRTANVGKMKGVIGMLAKYYKLYLNILTLPICFIGFLIPQGSLVYWVTNSSLTAIQQLALGHPAVRGKLGLPDKTAPVRSENSTDLGLPNIRNSGTQEHHVSVQNLSPEELLPLSVKLLSKGDKDRAIPLLRLALEKDPAHVRALVVLGQTLMQKGLLNEATEYFERAISKLFLDGPPRKDEELDLLILSSSWAGVTYIRQGKITEGLQHLQRIAQLNEPEDPKSKAHYYDGLLLLASTLFNEGQKEEAAKYLQLAAAYDPAYNVYLQQCLEDTEFLIKDQRDQQ